MKIKVNGAVRSGSLSRLVDKHQPHPKSKKRKIAKGACLPADDTVGGSDMVSGVGEGGGREATVNRTDGLGHCLYMGVEE